MKSTELLRHLSNKMGTVSDTALASILGIKPHALHRWRRDETLLTALQVANAINNAHKAATVHVHSHAIKPIVEFFPIEAVAVGRSGNYLQVFDTGDDCGKHLQGLCEMLTNAKSGLYIFYDTRGRALYAGQTKKQNIWKEMNLAFNRHRSGQIMTLVRHPTRDVSFKSAHIKVRQPTDTMLKLYDLAAYFSAYEVLPEMVDDLEALLIRAFPNDMLNYKMEKFAKSARKAAKTKAANLKKKAAR
ncbi:hypothetical protein JOD97_001660 [Duganella sp. 1411]|uniref:GIY-YIG nuclease family protein n=1 Tax=Duganella sp. 1411 TaxID=2806572 RepID=UPI001AE39E1A|nr:GIY-YIG nuclease family protein [Duganella sp. 1411]MBP1203646.1 hypothetical protein [Duganella sp. 1411]